MVVLVTQRPGRVELHRRGHVLPLLLRDPAQLLVEVGRLRAGGDQGVGDGRAVVRGALRDRRGLAQVVVVAGVLRGRGARLQQQAEDHEQRRSGRRRARRAGGAGSGSAVGRAAAAAGCSCRRGGEACSAAAAAPLWWPVRPRRSRTGCRRPWGPWTPRAYRASRSEPTRWRSRPAHGVSHSTCPKSPWRTTSSSAATGRSARSAPAAWATSGWRATSRRASTSR